eukprot:TRINITY_DN12770_c0_g6_i1.p1 TRINITY_DN12770_c0_g6~~TRINITY_DN12770_c0_g6_i1.p1  ORF type:complete len:924 (+),score=268.11 TRINITY_DN12770_c0_g6_i1:62-2773(+)
MVVWGGFSPACVRQDPRRMLRVLLPVLVAGLLFPQLAEGNWLLQCSSCVDQAYFGDTHLKENIKDADLSVLLAQIKQVRLREFDHKEDEFYNKFFSKRQLGVVTQEVQSIMPSAVALLPERRWTNSKGMSNASKNVMLLRDSQMMFAAMGALQLLARRADYWDATIEKLDKEMVEVLTEQNDNRQKREEMLEQIVRVIAKVEVMQHALTKTEQGFVRLDTQVTQFKAKQEENHQNVLTGLEEAKNRTDAQDEIIAKFMQDFREAVEREARLDLVEKRKSVEAELEVTLVKRSIEKLKWEEEQKTITMREEEKRKSEDHNSKLHQERVAHELEQKKATDLELMHKQEESNMRQQEAKVMGEKELLLLRLKSEEKRAEIDVQKAIEQSKIEQEAKIRERRENEDVHLRHMQAEQQEKRQQLLEAIKATASIAQDWVTSLYSSPQSLMTAIGSIVATLAGAYLAREMAILLREQLNKRLGRPSLVRSTNRRGTIQELRLFVLRLFRLIPPKGSEFSDVVLHPRLQQQVMRLADATASAKNRRMPLQHIMFYGPPGTGKTMVAQRFAEYSGLEYAIMAGGDVAPLQEQGVTELHKLFKWVHRSSRGVLLFIDEADAFLASRKSTQMSEALRNALTTMLYHTGTPTSQFLMVLATNRPGDLDAAILDRIDESVEFGLPDIDARHGMVKQYFRMYIEKPLTLKVLGPQEDPEVEASRSRFPCGNRSKKPVAKAQPAKPDEKKPEAAAPGKDAAAVNGRKGSKDQPAAGVVGERAPKRESLVDDGALQEVARRLNGFSGREIAKLMMSLQTHVLYNSRAVEIKRYLPKNLLFQVIDQKVLEHERTATFQVTGYDYVHHESGHGTPVIGTPIVTPNGTFHVPRTMRRHISHEEPVEEHAAVPPMPGNDAKQ